MKNTIYDMLSLQENLDNQDYENISSILCKSLISIRANFNGLLEPQDLWSWGCPIIIPRRNDRYINTNFILNTHALIVEFVDGIFEGVVKKEIVIRFDINWKSNKCKIHIIEKELI